jgi:hypothetical protein
MIFQHYHFIPYLLSIVSEVYKLNSEMAMFILVLEAF